MIVHYLPYARRLACGYRHRGEDLADLVQVAALGLIRAVDRYDPAHGVPFPPFARATIIGELKHHFRDRVPTLRVIRPVQENWLAVRAATPRLAQRLSRLPTIAELATDLAIGEADVTASMLAAAVCHPLSLNTIDDPDTGAELGDQVGGPEPAFAAVDNRETLRLPLARLPRREQHIIAMRFYGNMTQAEIGAALGISQMHISRLLAHALTKLRTAMTVTR